MADRTILHSDANCFYASVEMLHRPEYRHVPMAGVGDWGGQFGRRSGGETRDCAYGKLYSEARGSEDGHGAVVGKAGVSGGDICAAENGLVSAVFPYVK